MNVFLSWSGSRSKHVAVTLREWLRCVLQGLQPWMSEIDLPAGSRWGPEMDRQLQATDFAILCITPENATAPWILFEAGAAAKSVNDSCVCPYLIGMYPPQLPAGPLTRLQAKTADRAGTWDLLRSANNRLTASRLTETELAKVFDRWWPDLESALVSLPRLEGPPSPQRSVESIAGETLELVRDLVRHTGGAPGIGADLDTVLLRLNHELLSPLDGALVTVEWLRLQLRKETGMSQETRDRIITRVEYLEQAMQSISMIVRTVASGRPSDRLRPVLLRQSIHDAINLLGRSGQDSRAQVTVDCDPEATVAADPDVLGRVMFALLANAIQAVEPDEKSPNVQVRCATEGDMLVVDVADNGRGFSEHEVVFAFDQGFRGERASARRPQGLGIGLAFVRSALMNLGGQVRIQSPRRPTIVRCILPRHA